MTSKQILVAGFFMSITAQLSGMECSLVLAGKAEEAITQSTNLPDLPPELIRHIAGFLRKLDVEGQAGCYDHQWDSTISLERVCRRLRFALAPLDAVAKRRWNRQIIANAMRCWM